MTVDRAERLTLRVPEVAELLGVSRSIVYDWVEAGLIPHVKVGRTVLIGVRDLDEWLARQTRRKGA